MPGLLSIKSTGFFFLRHSRSFLFFFHRRTHLSGNLRGCITPHCAHHALPSPEAIATLVPPLLPSHILSMTAIHHFTASPKLRSLAHKTLTVPSVDFPLRGPVYMGCYSPAPIASLIVYPDSHRPTALFAHLTLYIPAHFRTSFYIISILSRLSSSILQHCLMRPPTAQ
jgi:hypothetical protein